MNILQNFEASILAAHSPNCMIVNGILGNLKLEWSFNLSEPLMGEFVYTPKDDIVELDILEITRLIYLNLENYTDPFTYTATTLYETGDNYHYGELNLMLTDSEEGGISIDLKIINASLQINECVILPQYIGRELGSKLLVEPEGVLNFDLNQDLA